MNLFLVHHFLAYTFLIEISIQLVASSEYAKSGCMDMCGKVTIPYPFGIGSNCALNNWYVIDCNSSKPYLSSLQNYEVLGVDLASQTITVKAPMISNCQNTVFPMNQSMSIDLGKSPFILSKSHNKLVVNGCGIATILDQGSMHAAGCSSSCVNESTFRVRGNKCFGISCCQTKVPHYLKSFTINLIKLGKRDGDEGCGSAFLVDLRSYERKNFSGRSIDGYVPMSLMWMLSRRDISQTSCCKDRSSLRHEKLDLGNGTSLDSWGCHPWWTDWEGNPYLLAACQVNEECERCEDIGGYCGYDRIWDDLDGIAQFKWNFTCTDESGRIIKVDHESKASLGLILGISISMGVVFIMAMSYVLYKVIKKMITKRQRMRFFKRNGGLLLKQQEVHPSLIDKAILFTSRELEKATDYFNENRIVGRGGHGTVYKGMLADGRIVAIKKSELVNESQLQQFINEVIILSQVNHKNVVKLLGCCLETEVPLLVSEFIPNGTLYDHIHNEFDDLPISLNIRLQIASEVSGALAYLHSATSIPIYHRDIKSTNILLDHKYRAKVSDFGTSRFVSIDQTHLSTLVKGTFGYLDPEYFQTSQFTEKSDVYSFGVVLVELLTGEMPISHTRFGENRSLVTHFLSAMEDGHAQSIFDETVIKEGTREDLSAIANLAMLCLNLNRKNRPTMKEVAIELETIKTSHIPSIVQTNVEQVMCGEEPEMTTYLESTSTFSSLDNNTSHSM